jgi:RND family efflux transporter MFP subunit
MNARCRHGLLVWGVLLVAACGGPPDAAPVRSADARALVRVAVVRLDSLRESLVAYGTVVPAPGSARNFSVPFEAVVSRLHVSRGQRVTAGQRMVDLVLSTDAELQVQSARAAVTAARGRAANVRQRLQLGLTTRDELLAQEQLLADAEARWKAYSAWNDGLALHATLDGVIDRLPVSEGQRVPAGDLVLSVVAGARFEIALGVEPEDAPRVTPGQHVVVDRRASGSMEVPLAGRVRNVSFVVDSATRLATALVVPVEHRDQLLLGEYVRATMTIGVDRGLVVPRSALLPQEGGTVLFVIHDGRAFRRTVDVGVETDSLVQIMGATVQGGDTVVVLGNYELADSMLVRVDDGRPRATRGTVPQPPRQE